MKKITFLTILLFTFNSIHAQITIQGTVTDEITYLPSANIYIKNTTTGTTSDELGNFTLNVKKGDTLAISYTGYQTQEIVINNQEFIPITLDNESLDEVIITSQSSRRITCSTRCSWSVVTEEASEHFSNSFSTPSLYPNPSSNGIFHLKIPTPYKEVQVAVTNLLGQQVQSKRYQHTTTSITLDLTSMKTGIYLINMTADGERLSTQKAIRK